MTAHSKWNAQPLNMTMNQETIDHMIAAVEHIITHGNAVGLRSRPVHLLVKEKEFKYGKVKSILPLLTEAQISLERMSNT